MHELNARINYMLWSRRFPSSGASQFKSANYIPPTKSTCMFYKIDQISKMFLSCLEENNWLVQLERLSTSSFFIVYKSIFIV